MAKYCKSCNEFKGDIKTCCYCGFPVCKDCRVSLYLCKDCYIEKNTDSLLGDYYNEKEVIMVINGN